MKRVKKIDLSEFESKIKLRTIQPDDFDEIVELQEACFPGMKPWSREQFDSQLEHFPEGQFCVEYDGEVVASATSLIVDFDLYSEWHNWKDISDNGYIRNHDPKGDTLYGIEIMVHPECRSMKLARRLYEARKQLVRDRNLKSIVIGGRIPGYRVHAKELTAHEYAENVEDKTLYDPVLTTQLANGFELKKMIPDYMPSDEDSAGWATYLEWTNVDYRPYKKRAIRPVQVVRIAAVQYQMRTISSFEDFQKQCVYFVDTASDYKCDFVLFPELITTQLLSFCDTKRPGDAARKLAEFTPAYLEMFSEFAIRFNINIIGGSTFVIEDDMLYNVGYLFGRDGSIGKQYKIHVTPAEWKWWGVNGGNRMEVFDTDCGRVAIMICYDIEFPELARIAAAKGAQIIFVPFNTDERHGYLRVRHCALARCVENHVYVAVAGPVGNLPFVNNADIHYAQSGIFTPADFSFSRDAIAAECNPNIETIVINDVDVELLRRHRYRGTTTNWNDRRKDMYEIRYTEEGKSRGI
ncbi:MAG TPA: GNAT family N-acetyltransferase [Kiritimatiellia bacterium]|nr:GNAT family N-acetyltransferase [Kiritimatiellia bacterium]